MSPLRSPERTSEMLGVALSTLANWRSSRRVILPYVRVGRRVMYREEDIERFVESRVVTGTAEAARP